MKRLSKFLIVLAAVTLLAGSLLPGAALAHGWHGGHGGQGGHGGCGWYHLK